MQRWIVHVGPGKTGTTFLQERVFAGSDEVHAAGRPGHKRPEYRQFWQDLTQEENADLAVARMQRFVEEEERRAEGRTIVLSDETLALAPIWCELARRLRLVLPDATILLTIRNQLSAIVSYYSNHGRVLRDVPHPYPGRHVAFDHWFDHAVRGGNNRYVEALDYDAFAGVFERAFPDQVRLLKYEALLRDRVDFGRDLSGVLGVDVGPSLSDSAKVNPRQTRRAMAYERLRTSVLPGVSLGSILPFGNHLQALVARFIKGGSSISVELNREQSRWIAQHFAAGNAAVNQAYGLELDHEGYPLPD